MNIHLLELIKVVNDNYNHIVQLEALDNLLNTEETKEEYIVCKTTHNSHYNYRLFGHKKYQDPTNHIDNFIEVKNNHWINGIKDKSITVVPDGESIYYGK